jgi:hypothetical protein
MTTNQIVAMLFPLLAVVAVGLTGLFVRKPWNEPKTQSSLPDEFERDIEEAWRHLDRAKRHLGMRRQQLADRPKTAVKIPNQP